MDFEKTTIFLLLWISGVLGQTDMKEKLFAFPKESPSSHVRLLPERLGPFGEATVCMRFRSDLTRPYSLFSLSTQRNDNDFLLFYYPVPKNQLVLSVHNRDQPYDLQGNDFTQWTSVCATWNTSAWVLWIDGKKYKKDGRLDVEISAYPIVIIGQEPDSYGGRFDKAQSFVGEITDINMWDKALTDEDVIEYLAANEMSGNVINWKALNFTVFEDVNILPYVDPYPCIPV